MPGDMTPMSMIPSLSRPLEKHELDILPPVTGLLDNLIEIASAARPGIDAATYADALRKLADDSNALADAITIMLFPPPTLRVVDSRTVANDAG